MLREIRIGFVIITFMAGTCGCNISNQKGESQYSSKFQEQIEVLKTVARKYSYFHQNGRSWDDFKTSNQSVFESDQILRAEIMIPENSTSLLIKNQIEGKYVLFFAKTPQEGEILISKGYWIKEDERVDIVEYLQGISNSNDNYTIIKLVVKDLQKEK